jgi:hypothetical protein
MEATDSSTNNLREKHRERNMLGPKHGGAGIGLGLEYDCHGLAVIYLKHHILKAGQL